MADNETQTYTPRTVTIQPFAEPDAVRPYPWHIGPDGAVLRQDRWRGTPARLEGFAAESVTGVVDLELDEFLAAPQRAVGMFPVFVNGDGSMATGEVAIMEVRDSDDPQSVTGQGEQPCLS